MVTANFDLRAMEVVESVLVAELCNLFGALVIPRNYVNPVATLFQDFTRCINVPAPVDQVTCRKIIICFCFHVPLQHLQIVMNIGKNEKLHYFDIVERCPATRCALMWSEEQTKVS